VDSVPAANTLQTLLNANADPAIRDNHGLLPVHYACYYDGAAPMIVLGKAGVDIEAPVEGLEVNPEAEVDVNLALELKQVGVHTHHTYHIHTGMLVGEGRRV
jgi:ankyrin repeat protein